jgi:formylglycine-generating enzyme
MYSVHSQDNSFTPPETVYIQGGTFQMGTDVGERDAGPVHNVILSDYYLGKYEVTVRQFGQFISETGYKTDADKEGGSYVSTVGGWGLQEGSNWQCDIFGNARPDSLADYPVINVSWNDATEYCKWLSQKTGKNYCLPTEAQWEYAAGNGSAHMEYSWGNNAPNGRNGGNIADESAASAYEWTMIWQGYDDGYPNIAPVGSYDPNKLGLFDMTGNIFEWCYDWYDVRYDKSAPANDPHGKDKGSSKVMRGGSWRTNPDFSKITFRDKAHPSICFYGTGFRVCRMD